MRTLIRALTVASSALALAAATCPTASADSPVLLEPFSFQFSEQDALMTDACGFPVQATIVASGIDRSSSSGPGASSTWAPCAPRSSSAPGPTR